MNFCLKKTTTSGNKSYDGSLVLTVSGQNTHENTSGPLMVPEKSAINRLLGGVLVIHTVCK